MLAVFSETIVKTSVPRLASVFGYGKITMTIGVEHHEVRAADGLRLHASFYGAARPGAMPVVCLPGLTRSSRDFEVLARRLAIGHRVICIDYRGRGLSDVDPDWRNYNLEVEGRDIETVLAGFGIVRAVFVGTSRGGLHAMRFAKIAPGLVGGAVLNDIGPVLEVAGLRRIRGYVGVGAPPTTLAEAVAAVEAAADGRFPALSAADWVTYATMTYGAPDGSFGRRYDRQLTRTLADLDLDTLQPTLWPLFDALAETPLLAIRGALSDLLAPSTFAQMAARADSFVVPGQGHAPLLIDTPTCDVIVDFVDRVAEGAQT